MTFDFLQAGGTVMCEYGTRSELNSCERKSETDQNPIKNMVTICAHTVSIIYSLRAEAASEQWGWWGQ
jgi:hypothetical protein